MVVHPFPNLAQLAQPFMDSLHLLFRRGDVINHPWVVTVQGLERADADGGVHAVVVRELGFWEQGCPLGLFAAEAPQVMLQTLVGSFGLSIGLRVVSGRESLFGFSDLA